MRVRAVRNPGLAQVADIVQVLLNLFVAPRKVQCHLWHVMEAAAWASPAADVVNVEARGFPLLAHLDEGLSGRIPGIRRKAYPFHAELLQIQHVFRGRRTRAGADLDSGRDGR